MSAHFIGHVTVLHELAWETGEEKSKQIKYSMINPSNFIVLHTFNIIMKASLLNWHKSLCED